MQVVEKSSQGLSRVLQVVIPASDLGAKLESKIAEVAPRVNLKGFRPGKVPVAHVRKMFARDLMGEIVQDALNESSQKALDDAKLRPASQPELKPVSDLNKVVAGEEDLSYEIELEVMPEFEPVDVATLELKRPTYEAQDADVQEALDQLLSQSKTYEAKGGKAPKAAEGDQLLIDFVGKIDGEAFPGGTATDAELVIGSGQFIPGFEDQLVGAKKGEERVLNVTFPENYGAAHLAGKAATFDVTVKEIRAAKDAEADDAFAERLGFENLDALKNALKVQLDQQYGQASRFKTKRALLDILDAKHAFDLPAKMVDAEFQGIWAQVDSDRQGGRLPPEDADKSEDQLRDEYRKIAERRVRLGLVLAEIGRANNVVVTDQELAGAIAQEARRYPGQERQVFEFYQKNQQLAAQLRAPIYEEKVVDLILSKAKVENEAISKEALFEDEELDLG